MWFASTLLLLSTLLPASQDGGDTGHDPAPEPSDETSNVELIMGKMEEFSPERRARIAADMEAYGSLNNRFLNEMMGHEIQVWELRRAEGSGVKIPESPIITFAPFFEALARDGNGPASMWMVRNANMIHKEPVDRRNTLIENLDRLSKDYAWASYWHEAMDKFKGMRALLGEEYVIGLLHRIQDEAHIPKVAAKAFYTEAALLTAKEHRGNEERHAKAVDIWRILVDGYSGTESARLAASPLFNALQIQLREAQIKWAGEVRELMSQGQGVEAWPRVPITDFATRVQAISATKHELAKVWANRFLPGLEQASRKGTKEELAFMISWYFRRFSQANASWREVKFVLLDVFFRAFPDSEESQMLLENMTRFVSENYPETYLPALDVLLEGTTKPETKYHALLNRGFVLLRGKTDEELEEGLAILDRVAEESPKVDFKIAAREAAQEFRWYHVGALHNTMNLVDAERVHFTSMAYRGRILLMHFWTIRAKGARDDIRWVNSVFERFADYPVSVLGSNVDANDRQSFRKTSAKYGIAWRNVLHQTRDSNIPRQWKIVHYPTSVVIDAEGVIRGRNLSHEETEALIVELLQEMGVEMGAEAAIDRKVGGLRGKVSYGGSREALPALEISDAQRADCSAPSREFDDENRSLLVAEDGALANVAIWIDVPAAASKPKPSTALINQRDCRFEPHVVHISPGSLLWLRNSDSVSRAVSATSAANSDFELLQDPGNQVKRNIKSPDRFEIVSSTHPWMSSWVVVSPSDFRGLSDAQGRFEIADLPAGTYTANWWHETLGEGNSVEFTVPADGIARLDLVIPAK